MIKKGKEGSAPGQTSNRILTGTSIQGEITSDGDLRVDGTMKGNISIDGKLVVGEKGSVEGEVRCGAAAISGRFEGTLQVEGTLALESTANVTGDIITGKFSVVPGAEFSGSCSMGAVVRQMKKDEEQKQASGEAAKRKERVS